MAVEKARGDVIRISVTSPGGGEHDGPVWAHPISAPMKRLFPPQIPAPKQGCCSSLRCQSEKYCEDTTLHGVKYGFRETGCKKCYWLLILIGMLFLAIRSIYGVVSTYMNTPTLVSIDSTDFPIHKIRFPALTVCNLNKVNVNFIPPEQEKVFGRTLYSNSTEWAVRVMDLLKLMYSEEPCESDNECGVPANVSDAQLYSTEQVKRIMQLTSPSCDEMISTCSWRGSEVPCSSIFITHHTDFGYCCMFNVDPDNETTFKRLFTGPGDKNGLTLMLDAKRYEYFQSQFLSVGFKVLVHGTHEEPEVRERGMAIQPGREIFVAVTAEETFTTELAEITFTPVQRNCFKEHEVNLQFGDTSAYTLSNCLLSHKAEALFAHCGCVAYYMPGIGEICHEKTIPCLRNFLHLLAQDFDLSTHFWDQCLPSCDEIKYSTELSTSEFPSRELISNKAFEKIFYTIIAKMCLAPERHRQHDWAAVTDRSCQLVRTGHYRHLMTNATVAGKLYSLAVVYAQQNMAKMHVYFKASSGTRFKRDVLYTNDQFIANIGGVLGLFLGFSIVSMFEVFYFFVMNFTSSCGSDVSPRKECHVHR